MALDIANYVAESASNPGTGTVNLDGALQNRLAFVDAIGSGNNTYYFITDGTQAEWGVGTVTSGTPNTLARTTVLGNSDGDTDEIDFTGTVTVYGAVPAERTVALASGVAGPLFISADGVVILESDDLAAIASGPTVPDPSTLAEAQAICARYGIPFPQVGAGNTAIAAPVRRFPDMHDIGDMLIHAGFSSPVMEMEMLTLTYADLKPLMRDLKGIGAHNAAATRRRGLLEEAERLMLADHPVLPLYFYVNKHLIKPYVQGWTDNVMNVQYSKDLRLTDSP